MASVMAVRIRPGWITFTRTSVSSGTTEPIHHCQVSRKLPRNLTTDRRVGQETRRSQTQGPQQPAQRRNRPLGICALATSPGARAYYRPPPRRQRHPPSSITRPGQPLRRHPPRLLRRTHYDEYRLGAPHTPKPLDYLRPWDISQHQFCAEALKTTLPNPARTIAPEVSTEVGGCGVWCSTLEHRR